MKSFKLTLIATAVASLVSPMSAQAADTLFDNFTALPSSAGPIPVGGAGEATPITLSNPGFTQRSIADRTGQLAAGQPNTGSWDMITTNETGADKGRFLFTVFETGSAGVQRHDLTTGVSTTVWQSNGPAAAVFDASYWTPWGTFITAEENWTTAAGGATTNPYGRLFELKNPTTATNTADANFIHQNVIPRTSHEGIQFDSSNRMYFIDELNGGSVFRYTTAADMAQVLAGTADYFAAGLTEVLRVGDGNTANATGAVNWVAITDQNGAGLAGALTITDPNGVVSVDGRNTTDLAAFKGTDYQRPEDLQVQIGADSKERIYMATTTTNEVYSLNVTDGSISVFADRNTIDLATGLAIGSALTSPDNLAIDAEGNIYVIEDRNGGVDDDIWFAKDINKDGDLLDTGEGLARWASNGTQGSEFSGLYFDPFNPNRAWVNIQHPTSGNDRMIEIIATPAAVPVPGAIWLFGSALLGLIGKGRRKA